MRNNRREAPRFHPKTVLPEVPEGKKLVKFHGKPAVISDRGNEPLIGNTQFTKTQVADLVDLERQRLAALEIERFEMSNEERIEAMQKEVRGGSDDYLIRRKVSEGTVVFEKKCGVQSGGHGYE